MRRRRRDEKQRLRRSLGFADDDCVVGFTGTFGWWHGIDVLAAAIPRICAEVPAVKFLLIGDGTHKPQLDAEVERHGLDDRVRPGRPRAAGGGRAAAEGVRPLRVAAQQPHGRQQVLRIADQDLRVHGDGRRHRGERSRADRRGAVAGAARRPTSRAPTVTVTSERSVLCTPGNVDEFVAGRRRARAPSATSRPRSAATRVRRSPITIRGSSMSRVCGRSPPACRATAARREVETGDAYKDQVQNQWNNNPVGSETARGAQPHTLEWFQEVERYRYDVYAPWMPRGDGIRRVTPASRCSRSAAGWAPIWRSSRSNGAIVTDVDLSGGHLQIAQENFRLRGLDRPVRAPRRRDRCRSTTTASISCTRTACCTTRRTPGARSPRSSACSSPADGPS